MTPPELTKYPVVDIFHPLEEGIVEAGGKFCVLVVWHSLQMVHLTNHCVDSVVQPPHLCALVANTVDVFDFEAPISFNFCSSLTGFKRSIPAIRRPSRSMVPSSFMTLTCGEVVVDQPSHLDRGQGCDFTTPVYSGSACISNDWNPLLAWKVVYQSSPCSVGLLD